ERFATTMTVRVLGTEFSGVTRDLSASGLSFTTETTFPDGSALDLMITGAEGEIIVCEAVVTHCEPAGALTSVGVRLLRTAELQ
ncbi:MAG TPA: PilZ domain-containing protein, partial [Gemmatimonadales bacterium]|nr:PilZ domain-containing protein [Gemmatimonadales bacterium]